MGDLLETLGEELIAAVPSDLAQRGVRVQEGASETHQRLTNGGVLGRLGEHRLGDDSFAGRKDFTGDVSD